MTKARWTLTAGAIAACTAIAGAPVANAEPPAVPAGCTGGIAPNPSLEQGDPPEGYVFAPAAPVPPGTPTAKRPKLSTDRGAQHDGDKYALISTPDKLTSTAYADLKFVRGGVYTLTDWTGTEADNLESEGDVQQTGLRFYDANGEIVAENKQDVTHAVDTDGKVARQDFSPSEAPESATGVKFFASTNRNWIKWDCVYVQLAAYSVKTEVQDPKSGEWGSSATFEAGATAKYRTTVTNEGSVKLTGLTVKDPWCDKQPETIANIDTGKSATVTCAHANVTEADNAHVNTATVTGVKHPGGTLDEKTATASIRVTPPPAIDEIGDFVWHDGDRNGLQGNDEKGVANVKVTLKDASGQTVATATTGEDGKYLFAKLKDGIYQVCFDISATGDHRLTEPDAGDDAKDSDPDAATGCTATTTLSADNRKDLNLDAGIVVPKNRLGDFVWHDRNGDGAQAKNEIGVPGIRVTLHDAKGEPTGQAKITGPDGRFAFEDMSDGSYQLCFDTENLPVGFVGATLTKAGVNGRDGTDSSPDPDTKCTPATDVGPGKRENTKLDAGLVVPERVL